MIIFEPPKVQRQKEALLQLQRHIGELAWVAGGGKRAVEHLSGDRVIDRGLQAVPGCAQDAEDDAKSRLIEAGSGAQTDGVGSTESLGRWTSSSTSSGDGGSQRPSW